MPTDAKTAADMMKKVKARKATDRVMEIASDVSCKTYVEPLKFQGVHQIAWSHSNTKAAWHLFARHLLKNPLDVSRDGTAQLRFALNCRHRP
jgi:hypothetical protein